MKELETSKELRISNLSTAEEYSVTGGAGIMKLVRDLAKGVISWKTFIMGIILEYGDEFIEGFMEGWNDPYGTKEGYDKDGNILIAE